MSQWGKTKEIQDCKFIPSVKTNAFEPILCDSVIEDIFCIDYGFSQRLAEKILSDLKKQYIDQPNKDW